MSLQDTYAKLQPTEEHTPEKILTSLTVSDKHLPMKTHVKQPLEMTALQVVALYFKHNHLPKSAHLTNELVRIYKENMVSYNRLSREEITKTLSAIKHLKTNLSFTEKLMGSKKE